MQCRLESILLLSISIRWQVDKRDKLFIHFILCKQKWLSNSNHPCALTMPCSVYKMRAKRMGCSQKKGKNGVVLWAGEVTWWDFKDGVTAERQSFVIIHLTLFCSFVAIMPSEIDLEVQSVLCSQWLWRTGWSCPLTWMSWRISQ